MVNNRFDTIYSLFVLRFFWFFFSGFSNEFCKQLKPKRQKQKM